MNVLQEDVRAEEWSPLHKCGRHGGAECGWQGVSVLKIGLDELPDDILSNLHRLGSRSPLRHEPRQVVACREETALRRQLDMDWKEYLFHQGILRAS